MNSNSLPLGLPFGLLELDANGTVVRYSPALEEAALLNVDQVVGRNFFNELVPVAEIKDFKGRFLAFMAYGDSVQRFTIRFPVHHQIIKVQFVLARLADTSVLGRERVALVRLMPDGSTMPA